MALLKVLWDLLVLEEFFVRIGVLLERAFALPFQSLYAFEAELIATIFAF